MNVGVYILFQTLVWIVDVIMLAMMGRMLVGWFTSGEQTKLGTFLFVVTEPVIVPVRALCDKFGWFRGLPFDMPFFITSLLLMVVGLLLQFSLG